MLTFLKNNVSIILKKEINKGDEPNGKENSKNKSSEKKKNKKEYSENINISFSINNSKDGKLKAREEVIIRHGVECGALEMFNVDSYISYLLQ